VYEYLGIEAPASVEAKSFFSVLNDPSKSIRKNIYNVYGHWSRSIKTEDGFKLILYNVDGVLTTQLFDLKNDPWETKDLSKDERYFNRIASMRTLLKKEMAVTYDNLNIDLPNWGRTEKQKSRGS
jgi:hypothetical protein